MEKFIISNTKNYGKGVFANRGIEKGETVHILNGEKIGVRQLVDKILSGDESTDDSLQIGLKTYIDLDDISRSFNHSCNPSCGIRKKSKVFALRNIQKGEELTFDYSLTVAPTKWKMKCKCGSENCREEIGDILSVPYDRLETYKRAGAIQTYMKRLLKTIESGNYKMPACVKLACEKIENW